MISKLLLSILLFGTLFEIDAQEIRTIIKPVPTDSKMSPSTLKLSDKLEPNYAIGLESSLERNTLTNQTKLPYPIIFVHGLNSSLSTWDNTKNFLTSTFGLTDGGYFDANLNYDGSFNTSNKSTDSYLYYSNTNTASGGDFYFVNFAVNTGGIVYVNSDGTIDENGLNLSNQSAIAKQGYSLKDIIMAVMQLTGKDKVVLMGHSMGGLASREYLQNSSNWQLDGLHHIAKLATTGTPHGGSNMTDGGLFTKIDFSSEAIRDLKKLSVYLEGGYESSVPTSYYNRDVNCNGINNDGLILGLNQRNFFTDVDYSCVIGTALSILGFGGDGAVTVSSANLNNANSGYSNITQNIFSVFKVHTALPSDWYTIMQSIDEPNDFSIAYGVSLNNQSTYVGFNSVQSSSSPYQDDYDDYKFSLTSNSNVTISINKPTSLNLNARIVSSNLEQIGSINSNNGSSVINFTINDLPQGNYYLEIYGMPITNTISKYNFTLTSTALANENFELAETSKIFPNPTSSKISFNNSIENFETATVMNYLGQVVTEIKFDSFEVNQQIDLSSYTEGVYMLKLSNQKGSKTIRIIKE
jgi:pimeloyl-ACP methyl ester carboxylesterase